MTKDMINARAKRARKKAGKQIGVRVPNRTTIETFKDTDAGNNLTHCKDAGDMFRKLGI